MAERIAELLASFETQRVVEGRAMYVPFAYLVDVERGSAAQPVAAAVAVADVVSERVRKEWREALLSGKRVPRVRRGARAEVLLHRFLNSSR